MVLLRAADDLAKLAEQCERADRLGVRVLLDEPLLTVVPDAHALVHRAAHEEARLRDDQDLLDGTVVRLDRLEQRVCMQVPYTYGAVLRAREQEIPVESERGDRVRVSAQRGDELISVDGPHLHVRVVACRDHGHVHRVEAEREDLVRCVGLPYGLNLRHGVSPLRDVPHCDVSIKPGREQQFRAASHRDIEAAHSVCVLKEVDRRPGVRVPQPDRAVIVA
mmetsp:Transcript_7344/g.18801  ORF Transcript_7344/g.18801 Transcript_7344/m.18801 type:complete len:221 (-) Transcript_7344:1346-2008(-)